MKSRKKFHQAFCSKNISKAELPRLELTVNGIPVGELQLLPHSEYMSIHNGTGNSLAQAKKSDLRKVPRTEFGRKFREYYGFTRKNDPKFYDREYMFHRNHHGKCSWELEDSNRSKAKKRPFSDFRLKFKEHYGMTRADNTKLYNREYNFYRHHGRCRWELGFDKPPRNFDFGKKFKEHYGMTYVDTPKLYNSEYNYFHRHGKCRWEI